MGGRQGPHDNYRGRRSPGKTPSVESMNSLHSFHHALPHSTTPFFADGTSPQEMILLHHKLSSALSAKQSGSYIVNVTHDSFFAGMQDRRGGHRGGRGRSRSPVMIDRYQPGGPGGRLPRDDFYEQSREHASRNREDNRRRAPSPAPLIDRYVPGQTPQPIVRVNPLPNPLSLDFQVGFNWFAEWWRVEQSIKEDKDRQKDGGRRQPDRGIKGERESREDREKERGQIQVAYDAYKEELQIKMARAFVQQHKNEEWFKERYQPEIRDPFKQRLIEFRRGALSQWEYDIEQGVFDEFTLEGIYKAESDGLGGVVEKEEGETVAAAEVLGVGDLVPSRGGDIRDESALQPALLIKTLAPMVSRGKIEDFCKEHLGEQSGGFKWLSLSDPNPLKKCHRIGWIMIHPNSEQEAPPERGDGRDEDNGGEEDGMTDEQKPILSTAEKALEAINGKTIHDEPRGDFTCHVGVHVPTKEPRKKALWDLFSAPERIDRDLELAKRLVSKFDQDFGSEADGVAKVEQRVEELRSKGLLQTSAAATAKKEKKRQQILGMDEDEMEDGEEEEEEEEEEEGFIDEENDSEELLIQKKTLDLLVEYLRRVFNFCFFCVFEADSVHELIRKCPGGHLRRPRASLSSAAKNAAKASAQGQPFPLKRNQTEDGGENGSSPAVEKFNKNYKNDQQLSRAFNWVKTFEEKVLQILEPENVDVKKLGGKPLEEGLDEELKKFFKQEDESKFRCKVPECTKLFKGEAFWRKHVEKRHVEWYDSIKTDVSSSSQPSLRFPLMCLSVAHPCQHLRPGPLTHCSLSFRREQQWSLPYEQPQHYCWYSSWLQPLHINAVDERISRKLPTTEQLDSFSQFWQSHRSSAGLANAQPNRPQH